MSYLKNPLRRLSETERSFYCNMNARTRDCKTFAVLAPLSQGVTGLVVYAHRYVCSKKLDIECEAVVWAMVERMQLPHTEPLRPRPQLDRSQLLLVPESDDVEIERLSSKTLVNMLLERCQISEAEIAGRLHVPIDAVSAVRSTNARLSPMVRQSLVRLCKDTRNITAVMGV